MGCLKDFLDFLLVKKRYSSRTAELYERAVADFLVYAHAERFESFQTSSQAPAKEMSREFSCASSRAPAKELYRIHAFAFSLSDEDVIEALQYQIIRGYVSSLMDNNLDARTVNLHLSALSTFCNYLVKQEKLATNPVKEVVRPKEKKRLPPFFTPDVLQQYFDAPIAINIKDSDSAHENIKQTYCAVRDRLIVTLLFSTGLRRAEAVLLKISDIDLIRHTISIIGKGNKQRFVPITNLLAEKIEDYLVLRNAFLNEISSGAIRHDAINSYAANGHSADTPDPVPASDKINDFFLTNRGKPLYPEFINKVVTTELSGIKAIAGKKSPHTLRHSFATALLNNGADLNSIKEVLGHSNLAATQVYTHNSFEKLREIYKTAHPKAKK